jgi:hypothetical protein
MIGLDFYLPYYIGLDFSPALLGLSTSLTNVTRAGLLLSFSLIKIEQFGFKTILFKLNLRR